MRRAFAIVAGLLLTTCAANAQPGVPPVFKVVVKTEPAKGQILFNELLFKTEARVEKRKVLKDGKEVEEQVTVEVMIPYMTTAMIDATNSRIITPNGKQLPIDEVWRRLKAN